MVTVTPVQQPTGRPPRRRQVPLVIGVVLVVFAAATVLLVSVAPRHVFRNTSTTTGEGIAASEARSLPVFSGVDLAGTNDVSVTVGESQRVVVHADRNLLAFVTTQVRGGVLVVSDTGSVTARSPMSVVVTVPLLRSVTLSGTGLVTVTGVTAPDFRARINGTGTVTASGRTGRLDADLSGDGTLMLGGLLAREATVHVAGTGTAYVHASNSLNADLSGTGTIVYGGEPGRVTKAVTGQGSIVAE